MQNTAARRSWWTLLALALAAVAVVISLWLRRGDMPLSPSASIPGDHAPVVQGDHDQRTGNEIPRSREVLEAPKRDELEAKPAIEGRSALGTDAKTPRAVDNLRLVYADHSPAAGLSLCRAEIRVGETGPGFRAAVSKWTCRSGADGTIAPEQLATLGRIALVRLDEHALELVALDPTMKEAIVARPLEHGLRLDHTDAELAEGVELSISTVPRVGFHNWDVVTDAKNKNSLSDHFVVDAGSAVDEQVFAHARLELRPGASTTIDLPPGEYELSPLRCPFGWWLDSAEIRLNGGPIVVHMRQVPIARLISKREPKSVRIFAKMARPDGSGGSGEIAVRHRIEGDNLSVSLDWRENDESDSQYALIIYWSDDTTTTTPLGPWEALQNSLDLSRF